MHTPDAGADMLELCLSLDPRVIPATHTDAQVREFVARELEPLIDAGAAAIVKARRDKTGPFAP